MRPSARRHAGALRWDGAAERPTARRNAGAPPSLRAVLDWGDLCCGDPAADLAIAWLGFDERGREGFRREASTPHPLDDPIWDRALGWAVALGLLFMLDAEPGTVAHGIGEHLLTQLRLGEEP